MTYKRETLSLFICLLYDIQETYCLSSIEYTFDSYMARTHSTQSESVCLFYVSYKNDKTEPKHFINML